MNGFGSAGGKGRGVAEGVCSADAEPSGRNGARDMGAIEVGEGRVELVNGGA